MFEASDDGPDAVVQVLSDGTVRIQTVLPDASSTHEFTYGFGEGITPVPAPDGGIDLIKATDDPARSLLVASIAAPWAVDAAKQAVSTSYVIEGNDLVQVVKPAESTVYPIVADPSYSLGAGVYLHFNRAETATLAGYGIGGTATIAAGCAALGVLAGGVGAPIAGGVCALYAAPFFYQAGIAQNSSPKKCVYLRMFSTWWSEGTYKDSRCN